jgi:hypothetical protein
MSKRWRITTRIDDLDEGLFGQVVLWTFEVLPALARLGVSPVWDIRSRLYGGRDGQVLPGVFDPVQPQDGPIDRDLSLLALRLRHVSVLGNDWQALHGLWHCFFTVPPRILEQADALALPPTTLGVHYRGTDKNTSASDTNPVSMGDMLTLVEEFLARHPSIQSLFIATDEHAFVEAARVRFRDLPVYNLGPVRFHKDPASEPAERADRALLDSVLLSRCACLLKTSSALSGFAKVLNPQLDAYRVAASKVFFGQIPYFPDAYIPRLTGHSEATRAILGRLLDGDWLDDPSVAPRYRGSFVSLPRYSPSQVVVNTLKYLVSVALGRPRKA